jgi:SAM-dependent methyltransferase
LSEVMDLTRIYEERFSETEQARKNEIWQVLCRHFFQRYVRPTDTVLDVGAGYCEFLNNIQCGARIAVDLNPVVPQYAVAGTRVLLTPSTDMSAIEPDSVDVVFASNFFEHLPDKDSFLQTLREIRRVLRPGGRLLILQPNIRVLGGQYWDFVDHHLPLTDRTLVEALGLIDMHVQEVRARFLPYTTKSAIPQHPLLVRLYLMFPPVHRIMGGQAWVVGVKPQS